MRGEINTNAMTEEEAIEYLAHYGVLGMRWGVRKDRRTGVRKGTPVKGTKRAKRSAPSLKKQRKQQKAKATKMTDQELRQAINRLNMEREYVKLTSPQKSSGRKEVEGILKSAGKQVATQYIADSLRGATKAATNVVTSKVKKSK